MDVDTTNQSAPPVSTARPTATDPRLNRVLNSSQNNSQSNKAPSPSTLSPNSGTPPPERQNASKSPSAGLPPRPNRLPSAKESETASITDLSQIVPSLNQLFDARAALVWRQHEKVVLEQEDSLLRRDLSLAKALPVSFPSLVDTMQSMKDRSSTGLQKLDAQLTKQQAICSDMAEDLRVMLRAASSSSAEEKTSNLEAKLKEDWKAEFKEWKAECKKEWKAEFKEQWKAECKEEWKAEFKEELADAEKKLEAKIRSTVETEFKEKLFSDLREQLQAEFKEKQSASTTANAESQGTMLLEFQEKFGRLENSVNFVSTSNRNLATQISRVDKWRRDLEEGRIHLPSQSEAPAGSSHQANPDLEKLKEQFPALETRLSQVEQQHSNWSGLESQVSENTGTPHSLKSAHELAQKDEQDKVATLETRIQQIQEQAATSSARIASLETQPRSVNGEDPVIAHLSGRVNQLLQQVSSFKGVAEEMQRHRDAIHGHSVQIDKCQKMQETMSVGLRSLEGRYSNINSEELVKSMTNAMFEMYPGMQKVHEQLKSLQVQFDASKVEITKEVNRLEGSMNNEDKASIDAALREVKQISEQFAQLQETQKSQADDIVRHLEQITDLYNRVEQFSEALVELGDKQTDASVLFDEIKALVPRVGEHDTHLENQAKQYKELEESCQRVRTQLDTLTESASEDSIRKICDDAQREKLLAISGQVGEFNLQCRSLLKWLENIQQQGFGNSGMSSESLQSLANGLLSGSGINGSFRIKGAATQNGSEQHQNGRSSQSNSQKNAPDTPMSARVTTNPPSPTVTITQNRNGTTGQDLPTASSAPSNGLPPKPPPQASAGKKRQRQTISDDESCEERTANPVLSNSAKPSPAPSSASDTLLRKNKKKKKEKRQQSQLK